VKPGSRNEQMRSHFLSRIGFGPTQAEIDRVQRLGIASYLEEQLSPENIPDPVVEAKLSGISTVRMSTRELYENFPPPKKAEQAGPPGMGGMRGPRYIVLELQQSRLLRAVYSRRQLYEVMVDFWTNHFNVFAAKGADRWLVTSYDRDAIRPHALGRFRDLLLATAKSPAMLFYLDNWLSVSPQSGSLLRTRPGLKQGLNENYARELLELHTLGVDGGYTQKDVEEVARCFTGWTIGRPRTAAEFRFNPRDHDSGGKQVLAATIAAGGGIEDGMKVIDLLSRHLSTARFIATKLVRRFVADEPPASLVGRVAETFHKTDGNIKAVLHSLFSDSEFYAPRFIRTKVKKPLEFAASALRAVEAETDAGPALLRYLARMGEPLFLALPPTGFPDGASSWVSPDALLTRMNFVLDLTRNRIPGTTVKRALDPMALAAPEFQRR
jgi:uncharacterized protein (DUF1800 family)